MTAFDRDFEAQVQITGRRLLASSRKQPRLYRGASGWMLRGAMADRALSGALFRFIDVLPQLKSHRAIADHLVAYLDHPALHGLRPLLLRLVARPSLAGLVRMTMRQLARQFLAEENPAGLARVIKELACVPAAVTVDAVGEAVLSEAAADAYLARNLALMQGLAHHGAVHLSLKLTALTPHFDPLDPVGTRQRVFRRLAPVVQEAIRLKACLTVDMEHHEFKPLIVDIFLAMLAEWPDTRWLPALALQAYLPSTCFDLNRIVSAAQHHGRRVGVRLVKGAYWDQEAAWAAQRGWPCPTYAQKAATDAHYERLTRHLLAHADTLSPAIAGHNPRSLAVALSHARRLNLAADRWEVQMLYGMAEPLRDALAAEGVPLRIYVPSGDAVIGIAYLIRRLLENTASTSILRLAYVDNERAEHLLASPLHAALTQAETLMKPDTHFTNEPLLDFSLAVVREEFDAALNALQTSPPRCHALDDAKSRAVSRYVARNPAAPSQMLGEIDLGGADHADQLLQRAMAAFPRWRDTSPRERATCLRRAADILQARRFDLAALELLEAGKSRREADADVAEGIDFLRYYADEMERLAGWHETARFPGERNVLGYEARGIALIIAPWNFPLAILAGMTAAALVAGNCAILKPAQPGLLIGHEFRRALLDAGVPADACPLLAAEGRVAAGLVADPRLHLIAFTGSREVGLSILQAAHTPTAGQRHIKQVVCEMGGKNAIVVDDDADLDEAVSGILASAFGYAGQKCSACSRVIAVAGVHDELLERLIDAAWAISWGPPVDPAYLYGPVINAAAQQKALEYIEIGRAEGRIAWQGTVPAEGYYVPPTLFADIKSHHRLAREEIFAPLLAVMVAPDFSSALALAQDSDYALTGGVYSRLPAHLELAQHSFRVGDLYLNRKITGARVGVQPFGGVALSGTGVQAGGRDYLRQFLWSRVVSVNEMRHGYMDRD